MQFGICEIGKKTNRLRLRVCWGQASFCVVLLLYSSDKPLKLAVSLADFAATETEKDHENSDNQIVPRRAGRKTRQQKRCNDQPRAEQDIDKSHGASDFSHRYYRESDD